MQLRQQQSELQKLGINVVVVSFEAADAARRYVMDMDLPWPVLVDEDRHLYAAYDMDRATAWQVWGPKTWLAYAQELRRGQRLKPSSSDVHQQGGDVLIDARGIVRLHHVGAGPSDRPSVDSILRMVAKG